MNRESLLILAQYNQWANGRILRKVGSLSAEILHTPCWLSHDSLWKTLLHTIDVQYSWHGASEAGKLPPLLTDANFPNIKALRSYWHDEDAHLIATISGLTNEQLNETIKITFAYARKPRHRIRWQILFHALNHSTHHRSEIGQYLDTIGRSPRDMDFLKYLNRQR